MDVIDWDAYEEEEFMGRRSVVGFGSGHRSSSRSGAVTYPYSGYSGYMGYTGSQQGSFWRKEVDLPAPLFINNYFQVNFTCGSCGKSYSTFSASPDVEVSCLFCGEDGHNEIVEVFEEFAMKEEYVACPACNLAVDPKGETPTSCPRCGGAYAKLEEGQEAKAAE